MSALKRREKEGYPPEIPYTDRTEVQGFYHPVILGVTISVLVRPQGMSDTLNRVNDRTGEIVSGIYLPPLPITCCGLGRGDRKRRGTHPVR